MALCASLYLQVAVPIRVMAALGVQMLIVTNAAGGINRLYEVGDLMIIKDHLYFPGVSGKNPLVRAHNFIPLRFFITKVRLEQMTSGLAHDFLRLMESTTILCAVSRIQQLKSLV